MARRAKSKAISTRAVGYIRVSTDEQHLGPVAQRQAIEAFARAHGLELVAVYEDRGISGGAPIDKRPALTAALGALEAHCAGVLLVAKRDRLARDTMAAAMIERLAERVGARVMGADGTGNGDGPEDLLMRRLVDAFSEYERALIRARTRGALAIKKARGERVGRVPYGFRLADDGVHLEADEGERATVAYARELRAQGITLQGVTDRLNAEGRPARGTRWHLTTVHTVLSRAGA